jgi:P27 family predicted phage terminase small subunit
MPGPTPSIHSIKSNDNRPSAVSDGIIPRAPKWLNKNAKSIYKDTAKEIVSLGIAGRCDENILALFSMQLDRLQTLSQMPNKEAADNRMLNDVTSSTISLAKELGITPSARAKLRIAKVQENDPLDELMNDE